MELVEGIATITDVENFVDDIAATGRTHDVAVQAMDARYVVDRIHIAQAVRLAARAIDRGEAVARNRSMEILLYAAGSRQIDQALEMGVKPGELPVVVVVDGANGPDVSERESAAAADIRDRLAPAATLGDPDVDRVREFFDVREPELAAAGGDLSGIIRERVAMLVVER